MTGTLIDVPTDEAAREYCRALTRREARNFYYGLRLLPEPQRSGLYCIYAWMRQIDDIADDEHDGRNPTIELERFRTQTREAFEGKVGTAPMWRGFSATIRQFALDPHPFDDMIQGQQADLTFVQPETMEDLAAYCQQVASSVGRICISIWGYRGESALDLADQRGIAFQMTNILRDIREDHENGRVYIPAELLASHGLDVDSLLAWRRPEACLALVQSLVKLAEHHYRASSGLDALVNPRCRPTLRAMTGIYHGLLSRIAREPRVVAGSRRISLGKLQKITIALRAKFPVKIP